MYASDILRVGSGVHLYCCAISPIIISRILNRCYWLWNQIYYIMPIVFIDIIGVYNCRYIPINRNSTNSNIIRCIVWAIPRTIVSDRVILERVCAWVIGACCQIYSIHICSVPVISSRMLNCIPYYFRTTVTLINTIIISWIYRVIFN